MPSPRSAALLLLAGASALLAAARDAGALRPESFDLEDLKLPEAPAQDRLDLPRFGGALARQGIVAVRMPGGFAELREDALTAAAQCMASPHADVSRVSLPGGTTRRTIAGESNAHGDGELGRLLGAGAPERCLRFQRRSAELRAAAAAAASAFGARLAQVLQPSAGLPAPEPEHRPRRNRSSSLAEAALRGPRLEHFHAYEREQGSAAEADPAAEMRMLKEMTLDFHADQGLFVVFSPGMMASQSGGASRRRAGDFQVRSADAEGNVVARSLELGEDEGASLVILLGDAVRQLGLARAEQLLHVPSHAFRMPADAARQQRLWYGLMQLPPGDLVAQNVVDPATSRKLTFGEIRERVAASAGYEGGSGIGCSPLAQWSEEAGSPRRLASRLLEAQHTCQNGSIHCWHRCMELPQNVSDAECAAIGTGYRVACVSQFDQLYVDGHGDYNPACSAATETVTPRPPVVQPSGGAESSQADWAALTTADAGQNAGFVHKVELDQAAGNTVLLWKSVDQGYFHAKMVHRGSVGWMALGLANLDDQIHNGMNGGRIVMAQNDPLRSASQGGPLGVDEYMIHPRMTAYRHWQTPLSVSEPQSSSLQGASFTMNNGASILEFRAQSFYKEALNLTSSNSANTFIWALTQNAYCTMEFGGYCAYHADQNNSLMRREEFRGVVKLDLASGSRIVEATTTTTAPGQADTSGARPRAAWLMLAAVPTAVSALFF